VFVEVFQRVLITREPDRSACLRLLEQWVRGVERAHGAKVHPELRWRYFAEGIDVEFAIPKPCEATLVFFCRKGRAAWKLLIINTGTLKRFYTSPGHQTDERKEWPGTTLEFVACGRFEEASFGFPSAKIEAVVPVSYPVAV
jgi:hypothetical protein